MEELKNLIDAMIKAGIKEASFPGADITRIEIGDHPDSDRVKFVTITGPIGPGLIYPELVEHDACGEVPRFDFKYRGREINKTVRYTITDMVGSALTAEVMFYHEA